ncbi:MAG: glutamyl-tRNA reductase [Verrucomicrobiales bacterium]|nr:glutamyl-tRNA reductase [Verrucomicrobiales bacterium]
MNLIVLGVSHHSAPVELRERFACSESETPALLGRVRTAGLGEEAVLVSTCNRVELYVATGRPAVEVAPVLRDFFLRDRGVLEPCGRQLYGLGGIAAAEHLFRVASGLDSLVLGETEILGQLKQAYAVALRSGATGRILNKVFQTAFAAAKKVRSETQIQRGNTSVASVAVDLAEKIFDRLSDRQVMVIGAGDTSEKTARALLSRGAHSVIVSNRSWDRAAALAEELGGRAIHFDEWEQEFGRLDIIISSTSAPHFILDFSRLQRLLARRPSRPLLLVDLAVPRDIDPEVKRLDGVFLANVDDLQAIADEHVRNRKEEMARCEQIIRDRVQALVQGLGPAAIAPSRWVFE